VRGRLTLGTRAAVVARRSAGGDTLPGMRHPSLLRLATLLVAALLALTACAQQSAPSNEPVQPDALAALLAADEAPLLLDVRTPEEFAEGHVPGATLVPLQQLEARVGELAAYEQRGVIAYCESGRRAGEAAELLRAKGFANVRLLDGSMRRWRNEQRELATGP
jgi:rhodanese-related sulfurtransferase